MVECEQAPVRVGAVNMNDAARCRSGWRPAAILELNPVILVSCEATSEQSISLALLGSVLNDRRAYSCALQRDRFRDWQCASPSGRPSRYGYGIAVNG